MRFSARIIRNDTDCELTREVPVSDISFLFNMVKSVTFFQQMIVGIRLGLRAISV